MLLGWAPAQLARLLDIPTVRDELHARQLIYERVGWDVAFPEPDEDGEVSVSKEDLDKLNLVQLKVLDALVDGKVYQKSPTKNDYTKSLAKRLQKSPMEPLYERKRSKRKKTDFRHFDEAHSGSPVVDFYTQRYNLQDRLNNYYYRTYCPSVEKAAAKLFLMSILHWQLISAWVLFSEANAIRASPSHSPTNNTINVSEYGSLTEFIMAAITQTVQLKK